MRILLASTVGAAQLFAFATMSFAASNPLDPDCPYVKMAQELSRKVDIYNNMCGDESELCASLKTDIDVQSSPIPNLIQENDNQLKFDPSIAAEYLGYVDTNSSLFDCDPLDEDCNGKTINMKDITSSIDGKEGQLGVLMNFPMSNFNAAERP